MSYAKNLFIELTPLESGTLFEPERVALGVRTIRELKLGFLLLVVWAVASGCMLRESFHGGSQGGTIGGSDDPIAPPGTHYGSLVDGDRVDVLLNGAKVIDNHTLVGGTGTLFSLDLLSGANELRVMALNEGMSSPNTAQLRLSDVTVGAAVQSWRLLAGESGSLVICCTQP